MIDPHPPVDWEKFWWRSNWWTYQEFWPEYKRMADLNDLERLKEDAAKKEQEIAHEAVSFWKRVYAFCEKYTEFVIGGILILLIILFVLT